MPVAPRDGGKDGPAGLLVIGIVGVGECEISNAGEDRFDPIEPRGVGRREHQLDVVVGGPVSHVGSRVGREVVEDEGEARRDRVFRADVLQEQQHFATPLAPVTPHHEAIGLDSVCRKVLAGAMETPVGRAQPCRVPDPSPRPPMIRTHFDGAEFVETNHAGVRRRRPVEGAEALF